MKAGMRAFVAVGLVATCAQAAIPTNLAKYSTYEFDMQSRQEDRAEPDHCSAEQTHTNLTIQELIDACTEQCGPVGRDSSTGEATMPLKEDMGQAMKLLLKFTPVYDQLTCNTHSALGDPSARETFAEGLLEDLYYDLLDDNIVSCVSDEHCACPINLAKVCFWYNPCIPELAPWMPNYECSQVCDVGQCTCPNEDAVSDLKMVGKTTKDEDLKVLLNPVNKGKDGNLWNSRGETVCDRLVLLTSAVTDDPAVNDVLTQMTLPDGWEVKRYEEGEPLPEGLADLEPGERYYFNADTGTSQLEIPIGGMTAGMNEQLSPPPSTRSSAHAASPIIALALGAFSLLI